MAKIPLFWHFFACFENSQKKVAQK